MTIGFPSATHPQPRWPRRRPQPLFARNGMVASGHPLTTASGLRVLASGGNAVDAAVAAALTANVVQPARCGVGGDLFAIVHDPRDGATLSFQGSGIAPRGASIALMREHGADGGRKMPIDGPLSVAVPGMIDGLFALLDRFGTRPFAELAGSAIGYAADGFPLSFEDATFIADNAALFRRFPSSAVVFLPDGRAPAPGAILRQPDLARTLRQIAAEGVDGFYRGDIARRIAAFLAANGGALTADDFADHATDASPPLATTYRGYTVYETCLPTQGLILLEALNLAERADLATLGVDTAEGVHLLAEAKKLAFADRNRTAGDPAFVATPVETLISKEWAAERYAAIDPARASEGEPELALKAADTTYLCVVDGNGMMVSLIESLSWGFGSGVVAGDTGIVLNNRAGSCFTLEEGHPNVYAPGKKTMHTLNCYSIADPEGTPVLVGGTPGGDGQPQWNLQVIAALIDGGLDVQAAIEQPRWTSWPGTYPHELPAPFELRVEDRFGDAVIADLAERGHRITRVGPWAGGGAAQAIARDPETGTLVAGSDPRVEGLALGL